MSPVSWLSPVSGNHRREKKKLRMKITSLAVVCALTFAGTVHAGSVPARAANGMVVCQEAIAAQVGIEAMQTGGNAMDAAVATAFALAVTLPTAGNIGGGGFLVYRPATGEPVAYDFREIAPARRHTRHVAQRRRVRSCAAPPEPPGRWGGRVRLPGCTWPGVRTGNFPGSDWSPPLSPWPAMGLK